MKVSDLLTYKRHDIKTDGKKITGYVNKNHKKVKVTVDKKLYNEALRLYNEVVKAKNLQTIKKNENTKINNEMKKIMKDYKLMNKKLDQSKQIYQETINDEPKLNMIPLLNNVAFRGTLETYVIKALDSNKYNYEKFLDDLKYRAIDLLEKQLVSKRGLRVQFTLLADFYLASDDDQEKKLEEKNFNSSCLPIVNNHDIKKCVSVYIDDIKLQISEFQAMKSGWIFYRNKSLVINSYRYKPLRGSSFIELPQIIKNKKGCLNVKNDDEKCFLYCIIAHDHPVKNIERQSMCKKYVKDYDVKGIDFPMTINHISKFEKQNNKSINVYAYEITYDNESKKQKLSVYPIRLSPNVITKHNECVNLLLIKEADKSHYVLIKNMSALVSEHTSKHASHVCPSCMKSYREVSKLDHHLKDSGCVKFGEKVELPSATEAKEYVKFKNVSKMLKKPFVIYADFESILKNVERDENATTQKYQQHEACGYAFKRVSTLEKYDKPLQLYRGDGTENVAEHFINAIVKENDEIRKIMSDVIPMNLTDDEEQQFQSCSKCYLCNVDYNDDDIKVRDHDHLTGSYRGSAHNACNLKYSWRHYKLPVIFHNLKGYDSHLIIKAFNNKNFSIDCIPTSTEKYLSFTISGQITFIDSLSFIMSSLENLVKALPKDKFNNFDKHFNTDIEQRLLKQKGIYPYDYMSSYQKIDETTFPNQKD